MPKPRPRQPSFALDENDLPVVDAEATVVDTEATVLVQPPLDKTAVMPRVDETVVMAAGDEEERDEQLSQLRKGDIVAGVRLLEAIASGQRVVCWRAELRSGEMATAHVLRPGASPDEVETFLDAARRLAALTGREGLEDIVRVARIDVEERIYIGQISAAGTLADLPVLQWGLEEKVRFLRRLCRAMSAVHQADLFHGCLCPYNVLLDEDLKPVISDVGAVRIAASFGADAKARNDYSPYAAREVRLGQRPNAASDVYSLGRLMHFVLAGRTPQEADEAVPELRGLTDAPEGLVRIIRRCTLRDPTQRYRSAADVLEEVNRYEDAASVGVRSAQTPPDASALPSGAGRTASPAAPAARAARLTARPVADVAYEAEEGDDRVTALQGFVLGGLGLVMLVGGLATAYFRGVDSALAALLVVVGSAGLTLMLPALARGLAARVLVMLVFAAIAYFLQPTAEVSRLGRERMLAKGSPADRALTIQRLASRGVDRFSQLDLRGVDFSGLDLSNLVFDGSLLNDARFVDATLRSTSLQDADVTGADFSGATLVRVDVGASVGWTQALCNENTTMPARWRCESGAPRPTTVIGLRGVEPEGEEQAE